MSDRDQSRGGGGDTSRSEDQLQRWWETVLGSDPPAATHEVDLRATVRIRFAMAPGADPEAASARLADTWAATVDDAELWARGIVPQAVVVDVDVEEVVSALRSAT